MIDLEAIEARVNAATPGPWKADIGKIEDWDIVVWGPIKEDPDDKPRPEFISNIGADRPSPGDTICFDGEANNARFIAAAREDVPALIAKVKELEAKLKLAKGLCEYVGDCCGCGDRGEAKKRFKEIWGDDHA